MNEVTARLQNVIESDKSLITEAGKSLIMQDFVNFFKEYFEFQNAPKMSISYENGIYEVEISFKSCRIHGFGVLK